MTVMLAFLDTNYLLHYRFPDQADWPVLLGADEVEIVLAPVVMREMNKHKDTPSSPKLRRRAAEILVNLDDLFSDDAVVPLRPGVTLRYETHHPLINFAKHQLNDREQDDHLIGSMIAYREAHPDNTVLLITADTGLRLKAREHGFTIYRPAAELKLPLEEDPREKRIREIERENAELRSRIPKLALQFTGGAKHLRVPIKPPIDFTKTISQRVAAIKEKYPKHPGAATGTVAAVLAATTALGQIDPEDIAKYNRQLDVFYEQYQAFLAAGADLVNARRRAVKLDLLVANTGTAPADDLDVILHFPDGFALFADGALPQPPKEPRPPTQPRSRIEQAINPRIYMPPPAISPSPLSAVDVFDPTAPRIRRTNSYEVKFHFERVKQQLNQPLKSLWLIFDDYNTASPFAIEYRLNAANLPQEITGQIHVIVEKVQEATD